MRKERRIGIITAATLALLFLLALSAATTAGAATVKVEPVTQSISAGGEFSVRVIIEDVTDMGMDQAVLNFDPSVMQASGIIEGEFLKSGGTTLPVIIMDNTDGAATFSYSLMAPDVGVTGSGVLATINFDTDASAEGSYDLELTEVVLADGNGKKIIVDAIFDGKVTIESELTPTPSPTEPPAGDGGDGFAPTPTPTPTPIEEEKTYKNITTGEEVKVELLDKELKITFKKNVSEVKITVKELVEKPADIPDAPGIVFRYLEYHIENVSAEDIEKATIPFDMPKSWIVSENIDPATIRLNRYYEGVWNPLRTEKVGEDTDYIHYSAETEGLSIFAISGEKKTGVEALSAARRVWGIVGAVLVIVVIASVWYIKKKRK
ncbi:MAG: Cohesin domain protein [Candidatus Argoarchaeum ethanivorans]|uniref:Cohesin domain protein n=1 Tax=Candidatus Argoarchaeum ethanivorans TaxID=2608793 RepID=A0A811T797_9EURY|nr:MAG: Cohesin domain protein [Candidatus Argoarchaeum ethanivorans]